MTEQLLKIFETSNEELLSKDIKNILNDTNERNLCGRLAIYLNDRIRTSDYSDYYVDNEYNRNLNGEIKTIIDDELNVININCDIIIHSRGETLKQDNLIAIEMKKSYRPQDDKDKDRNRLIALTKDSYDDVWSVDGKTLPEHVCGYVLGIYSEFDIESRTILIEYYQKGKMTEIKTLDF